VLMDMKVEKSFIDCRREIWHGCIRREEMCESVVPDTYPDIGSIIDVSGQVHIRGKEASAGKLSIECTVKCTVLYTAEDENGIFVLDTQLPVVLNAQVDAAAEDTDIVACPKIENLEVRLLNPRKILPRAEISAFVRCFEEGSLAVSSNADCSSGLHILEKSRDAYCVSDVREKTFVITDELALPPVAEGYSRILSTCAELNVDDTKFVGSKLIFKGEAKLRFLLEAEGKAEPVFFADTCSFSQIIELGSEVDSADVKLSLTGLYVSLIENEQGRAAAEIELHMLAQAVAGKICGISYIADAYSNKMDCILTK